MELSKTQKRKGRILALQVLYSYEHNRSASIVDVFEAVSSIPEAGLSSNDTIRFAKSLCVLAVRYITHIDKVLSDYTDNWDITRLSSIDRNTLRLAAAEIISDHATPFAVVINEAVEIAKEYGTDESASFINGVLDAAKNEIQKINKE
ncbi:transcription antitermination factor NusB [Chitinivibrio alkaliphilus]|uniref:Transcription antitermination protein NusB n=1 Tax=Chitinivibrio alkaliphilus ACht1 TaxID=1313304 RepID=U7DAT4_9BACT|nr:transcription antitermination factor NusB [Chitinivibrio alkaliphilus]ERP38683.1 NusB antitermination factor [Chitinivibrio alkaliphilus ACht1]